MALSESTIYFNYGQAMGKASQLSAAAGELESGAVNDMGAVITAVKRDWSGANADEYTSKCAAEQENLRQIANEMRVAASAMETMAENVKAAELRALEIARAEAAARRAAEEAAARRNNIQV